MQQVFKCKICGFKADKVAENTSHFMNGWCPNCGSPIKWSTTGQGYIPNKLSPLKFWGQLALCISLCIYISYSIYVGKVWLFYRVSSGRSDIVEYSGQGYLLAIITLIAVLAGGVLYIIDHFDERVNENSYKIYQYLCFGLGFISYCLAAFFGVEIDT
ncbi:MAG: hypothetical protein ACJAS1_006447 [Oleiphilaceae bacterium]|jgi:hypothetical protein